MNTTFEQIIFKTELTQSDVYGTLYEELLDNGKGTTFCNPLVEDVGELMNNILLKYDMLTDYQKEMLNKIFDEFNNIRLTIDPNRLKPFQHYYTDDEELLLYRETENGLINIIINSEECIAF